PGRNSGALEAALARYGASATSRTGTLEAIAEAYPGTPQQTALEVPFSSRRRWSALGVGGRSYVLGAPELFPLGTLEQRVEEEARQGRRAVALATTDQALGEVESDAKPPDHLELLGLVVIGERPRAEARETVEYFLAQG